MKLKIETSRQAKQACLNAVARGLAYQGWVSDGFVWHDRWHGTEHTIGNDPLTSFYSAMGWLVREGEHEKVFTARCTEAGVLTWSYQGVIGSSHSELVRWYSANVDTVGRMELIHFLRGLHTGYMGCKGKADLLYLTLQAVAKSHGLVWPSGAADPPPPPKREYIPSEDDGEPSGILVRRDE